MGIGPVRNRDWQGLEPWDLTAEYFAAKRAYDTDAQRTMRHACRPRLTFAEATAQEVEDALRRSQVKENRLAYFRERYRAKLAAEGKTPRVPMTREERKRRDRERQARKRAETSQNGPLCACGCGEQVRYQRGGYWAKYRRGHHHRKDVTRP